MRASWKRSSSLVRKPIRILSEVFSSLVEGCFIIQCQRTDVCRLIENISINAKFGFWFRRLTARRTRRCAGLFHIQVRIHRTCTQVPQGACSGIFMTACSDGWAKMRLYIASNTRHLHWRIFNKSVPGKGVGEKHAWAGISGSQQLLYY